MNEIIEKLKDILWYCDEHGINFASCLERATEEYENEQEE